MNIAGNRTVKLIFSRDVPCPTDDHVSICFIPRWIFSSRARPDQSRVPKAREIRRCFCQPRICLPRSVDRRPRKSLVVSTNDGCIRVVEPGHERRRGVKVTCCNSVEARAERALKDRRAIALLECEQCLHCRLCLRKWPVQHLQELCERRTVVHNAEGSPIRDRDRVKVHTVQDVVHTCTDSLASVRP